MLLLTASCTMPRTSIHSSSGTLPDLIFGFICYFHCIIIRDLFYVIPEWSSCFPYFLQFKPEFCNKEFMIWATVSSQSYFCWLSRTSSSLPAENIINLILVLAIWWCPCVQSSLVLLEEDVCYDQCILLAKLCKPASFCTPRPNLPITPGISWFPTFDFQSPMMKGHLFLMLVLEGLIGLHRTGEHQLLWH